MDEEQKDMEQESAQREDSEQENSEKAQTKNSQYITFNEDGSATVKLACPIMKDKKEVDEITLHRPKMRDIIKARVKDFSDNEQLCRLIALVSEFGQEELKDIDYFTDFGRIADAIAGFSTAKR